ncbi:hypothetical protein D3C81_1850540 [compost metagenome]
MAMNIMKQKNRTFCRTGFFNKYIIEKNANIKRKASEKSSFVIGIINAFMKNGTRTNINAKTKKAKLSLVLFIRIKANKIGQKTTYKGSGVK